MTSKKKNGIYNLLAVVLAVALWKILSVAVNSEVLLAPPEAVLGRIFKLIFEGRFWGTVIYSLSKIMCGFSAGFVVGVFSGILSGKFKIAETLLKPFIITSKAVPIASFIILCLIWFPFEILTVFISFLIVFPVMYTNVLEGIKSTDKNLTEMAELYSMPFFRKLLYIYLPEIKPYIISASKTGIGMAWKAGVAAEVIGTVNGSIGEKLYEAKIYLQNADLLAWTAVIILLSLVLEKIFVFLLKAVFGGIFKL